MKRKSYTLVDRNGKVLKTSDNLGEVRMAYCHTSFSKRPSIVYSKQVLNRLRSMQLKTKTKYIDRDFFPCTSVRGRMMCVTTLPATSKGDPFEVATFVPSFVKALEDRGFGRRKSEICGSSLVSARERAVLSTGSVLKSMYFRGGWN